MTATTVLPDRVLDTRQGETSFLAAIGLCSFAALLLELALTRLFSVVLFYHFAFLSISIALLGLGAGGVFAYIFRDWLLRWHVRRLGAVLAAVCAVVIVAVLEIVLHSQVHLVLSAHDFRALTILYLSSAVPFFLIGLIFSVVFARHAERISRLYGADLTGGALACLATVPLLNMLGAPNAILAAAAVLAIASIIWASQSQPRWIGVTLAFVLIALIVVNSIHPVIDADAATAIMSVDPYQLRSEGWEAALMATPASLPNMLRPHGEYAIIGPGGGVDVLRAVANGSPRVTGIEINPIIVNDVMRGRYAEFAHHLYEIPEVEIQVSDGRSSIRSSRDPYDVIQMTLVDTWASTAAGAFALS